MPKVGTILLILAAAAAGLFGWAYLQSKKPGATGGVWGTIGGLWGGANNLTQSVTSGTGQLGSKVIDGGEAVGGALKDAGGGVGSMARDAADTTRSILTLGLWD